MPLTAGTRLGSYEVTGALGAGGMGEVYRAHDTRLGRAVAVKLLPEALALDPERIARLEREARALAALNHPHIAGLYGFEVSDGRHFLVMELVEGETLADRLSRGPLPVQEGLIIARQIAEALESAHEKGIVHRDLKPANVKVTPDDRVKVLDFGLARLQDKDEPASPPNLTHSPTLSLMATQAGVILGTAAYMSPEQAKGLVADHRSDMFSFGTVLYEMLTGRQAFKADTAAETMAAVLMREPDFTALPRNLHPRVSELLRRCLEKNPRRRWQAAGDLRAEIETVLATPLTLPAASGAISAPARPLWRRALPLALTAVVAAMLAGGAVWRFARPSATALPVTFFMPLDDTQLFALGAVNVRWLTVSQDGTRVVFASGGGLWIRDLSSPEPVFIAGTENSLAAEPALSPDGESVAFISGTDRMLKRIATRGGVAIPLVPLQGPRGAVSITWGGDSIFVAQGSGIVRVSPTGTGEPERVISLAAGESAQGLQLLPDGTTLLFAVIDGTSQDAWDKANIVAQSIGSSAREPITAGSQPRYLRSGHLLYARGGIVFAVPFDATNLRPTGEEAPVLEGIARNPLGAAQYDVSSNGTIAYIPGPVQASAGWGLTTLAMLDERGNVDDLKLPAGRYEAPRISPNGRHVAYGLDDGRQSNVWIYDLDHTTAPRRLTFGGNNRYPVWSPDSTQVAFQSDRDGALGMFSQRADVSGVLAKPLTTPESGVAHVPESWYGDVLLFSAITPPPSGSADPVATLWTFSVSSGMSTQFRNVRSTAPLNAEFSRDGRFVAYTQRGDANVAVVIIEPFPPTGERLPLNESSHHPVWSPDRQTLFYIPGAGMVSGVNVSRQSAGLSFGKPTTWSGKLPNVNPFGPPRNFDIAPNGTQFVYTRPSVQVDAAGARRQTVQVIVNWQEEMQRRLQPRE